MSGGQGDPVLVDVLLALGALSACPSESTRAIGQRLYDARSKLYALVELAQTHDEEFDELVGRQRARLLSERPNVTHIGGRCRQ